MPPRRAADVLHDLFCRFLHRPGFLSHLRSLKGYDEPEILPSSTRPICLIGADAGRSERFIEAAHKLGCDEDPAHFDEILKKVAGHKLPPAAPPEPRKPKAKSRG